MLSFPSCVSFRIEMENWQAVACLLCGLHPLFKTVMMVTKISSISGKLGVVDHYSSGKFPLQSLSRKKSKQSCIVDLSC